jgi:hypothetical protein
VEPVHALDLLAPVGRHGEAVMDGDALDHQDAVAVEHLADGFDLVVVGLDFDVTRLQRACECAGQSPAGRGDDVVERRRVGRIVVRADAVVLGHLGVDAECDGFLLGRDVREPLRSAEPLDPDPGDVCGVGHVQRD